VKQPFANIGVADERLYVPTLHTEPAFCPMNGTHRDPKRTAVRTFSALAIDATAWSCIVELSSGPINRKVSLQDTARLMISGVTEDPAGEQAKKANRRSNIAV